MVAKSSSGKTRAEGLSAAVGRLKGAEILEGAPIAPDTIWIDLYNPSVAERQAVNGLLGMELPTRADMEEIEVSSRLYTEDGGACS